MTPMAVQKLGPKTATMVRPVTIDVAGFVHRCRIVSLNLRTRSPQRLHEHPARRLAHIIRAGFERQPPNGDRPLAQVIAEVLHDLLGQHLLLTIVDARNGPDQFRIVIDEARRMRQRRDVLRKTGPPVTASRVDKLVADARIGPDTDPDLSSLGTGAGP